MNYQTVSTLSASTGATGTWSFDGQLIPHPLQFGALIQTDSVNTGLISPVYNAQISNSGSGSVIGNMSNNFLGNFSAWRLAYAGVTVYMDAPELSNQGTMCVSQSSVNPISFG